MKAITGSLLGRFGVEGSGLRDAEGLAFRRVSGRGDSATSSVIGITRATVQPASAIVSTLCPLTLQMLGYHNTLPQ